MERMKQGKGRSARLRTHLARETTMTDDTKKKSTRRSQAWFGRQDRDGFIYRSWVKNRGIPHDQFDGRPVIGICNTYSELTPCNSHFRALAEQVKIGIWEAGGFPLEFPVMSLGETLLRPTAMLYRNLASMDVEESIRANPLDGVVLLMGCDKTTPALLMGAISVDLPAIFLPAGPMLNGNWNGVTLGSGSDTWKYWADLRAGKITEQDWKGVEGGIARSPGHCMTMGTASTMTSAAEALGFTLPGFASIPAPDSRHAQYAAKTGMRIVDMVWEDLKPSDILTRKSVDNAVTTCLALSGSTNAIVHMIALARRAGVDLTLAQYDEIARHTPVLANVRPTGKYLMEDFYYAGGLMAMLKELGERIDGTQRTVNGKTLGENIAEAQIFNDDVIRRRRNPVMPDTGLAVLRGNLAPDGAVIKPGAAEAHLHVHTGRAVVFKDYNDMAARIDSEELDVDENCVIVLQHAGPIGAPGMPEWGQLPIPQKILKKGVRDMLRISDARMSGTSYGACVLHVAPESFIGGPLALVQDGDMIELNVPERRLNVLISDEELARRKAAWVAPEPRFTRGYGAMHQMHVMQADKGCDFDFLQRDGAGGACASTGGEPEIH